MTPPHIIAIAGASCSGKTTIAGRLARALQERVQAAPAEHQARAEGETANVAVIALDSYYYDLSHLPPGEIRAYNLDEPAAIEHTLLIEHVAALARGEAIEKPLYDHKAHRRSTRRQRIEPGSFLIIEGLFALYWEEIRRHTHTPVFIDTTHDLCLARRIARDRSERGRTGEEVTHRYHTTVAPMYDRHVLPTRRHALIIVDGAAPSDASAAAVVAHIAAGAGGAGAGGGRAGEDNPARDGAARQNGEDEKAGGTT